MVAKKRTCAVGPGTLYHLIIRMTSFCVITNCPSATLVDPSTLGMVCATHRDEYANHLIEFTLHYEMDCYGYPDPEELNNLANLFNMPIEAVQAILGDPKEPKELRVYFQWLSHWKNARQLFPDYMDEAKVIRACAEVVEDLWDNNPFALTSVREMDDLDALVEKYKPRILERIGISPVPVSSPQLTMGGECIYWIQSNSKFLPCGKAALKDDVYCLHHRELPSAPVSAAAPVEAVKAPSVVAHCSFITLKGTQCSRKALKSQAFCKTHLEKEFQLMENSLKAKLTLEQVEAGWMSILPGEVCDRIIETYREKFPDLVEMESLSNLYEFMLDTPVKKAKKTKVAAAPVVQCVFTILKTGLQCKRKAVVGSDCCTYHNGAVSKKKAPKKQGVYLSRIELPVNLSGFLEEKSFPENQLIEDEAFTLRIRLNRYDPTSSRHEDLHFPKGKWDSHTVFSKIRQMLLNPLETEELEELLNHPNLDAADHEILENALSQDQEFLRIDALDSGTEIRSISKHKNQDNPDCTLYQIRLHV